MEKSYGELIMRIITIKDESSKTARSLFFLFFEVSIKNIQFVYVCICLNSLRYELHKLHFFQCFRK